MSRDVHISAAEFEQFMRHCFPDHALEDFGTNPFDYLVGNIRAAVTEEILLLMENWLITLSEASHSSHLQKGVPSRDWEVASSHVSEVMSEIRQYKTRGATTSTGSVPIVDFDAPA